MAFSLHSAHQSQSCGIFVPNELSGRFGSENHNSASKNKI